MSCSKGTYIRSLVNDIGGELGCGATLVDLRRIKVGNFSIKDAKPLEEILQEKSIEDYLIDIKTGLKELPDLILKKDFVKGAFCGTPVYKEAILNRDFKLDKGLIVKVSSEDGQLISVARCIREEKDLAKLAQNGIVFNHIRVFKPMDEARRMKNNSSIVRRPCKSIYSCPPFLIYFIILIVPSVISIT